MKKKFNNVILDIMERKNQFMENERVTLMNSLPSVITRKGTREEEELMDSHYTHPMDNIAHIHFVLVRCYPLDISLLVP